MEDRIDFRRDPLRLLIFSLAYVGGGIWMLWTWWSLNYGVTFDNRELSGHRRGTGGMIIPAVMLIGFGLWKLFKLGGQRVQVVVDRHGITDFRLKDVAIPWAEVERIEHVVVHKARGFRKPRALRLVMREASQVHSRHPGKGEIMIWAGEIAGGDLALKEAVTKMAPQVPRSWSDAKP